MNGLYAYDVLVWGKDLDDDTFETSVLGRPAALTMRVPEESERWVHGIVSSVVFEGRREAGRCTFRLTLVPRMWLLHKRVNSRIFQDLDVQQITDAILEEHGVVRAWTMQAHLAGYTVAILASEPMGARLSRFRTPVIGPVRSCWSSRGLRCGSRLRSRAPRRIPVATRLAAARAAAGSSS